MTYHYEVNSWGERFIPDLNRNAFETSSAASYFKHDLDFDALAEDKLTIITGSDSGLLFKYLCSQPVPASSRIVIIEPAEVFDIINEECKQWLSERPLQFKKSAVSLHSIEKLQSEIFNGDDIDYVFASEIHTSQAHCAIHDYQNIYYPLYREITQALSNRKYALHNQYNVKSFVEQQMQNCVDNHTPLRAQTEFGKDKVAVILGGGPSLDDQLAWIVQNRPRLFLISVSRISDKLQKLDLTPDLVVSVDPQPINYTAGKQGTLWEGVPLASGHHVSHQLLKQWRGPHYFTGSRFPWEDREMKPVDIIESGGPTVGHSAIVIASKLNFSTILLAGIDLCFNATGASHAQGTPEAELLKLPGNYDAQVTTYAGNTAGTSIDFFRSIESLDNIGKAFNPDADTIFNLNIHAAQVSSINHIAADQIALPDGKPILDTSDYSELTIPQLGDLKKQILGYKKDFEKIQTICLKAKVCIDRIYGKKGNAPNPGYHKRLDALEDRLNKIDSYAINTVRHFMGPEFAQLRKPSGFDEMDQEDMERWAREYYNITHMGSEYFKKALTRALRIIELRKAEQSDEPDIGYLLEQWLKQETPGRVQIFCEHLLSHANEEEKILIESAAATYHQSLFEKDMLRERKLKTRHGSIEKTMQSLRYLRNKQCLSDLQLYSSKLVGLEWPYGTIARFIEAIIAESQSHSEAALQLYQQVLDDCGEQLNNGNEKLETVSRLIEESLSNLTRLFLDKQDGESALSTLGMLSEISPQYIPSYANLLNLMNNHEAAVELLNLYLTTFKKDFRAARQLAKIHEKAGNMHACQKALELCDDMRRTTDTVTTKAA